MFSIGLFCHKLLSILLLFVQIEVFAQGGQVCHLPTTSESDGIQLSCSKGWLRKTWNNCTGSQVFGTKLQLNCMDGFVQPRTPSGIQNQMYIYICDYDGTWSGGTNMSDFNCVKNEFLEKAADTDSYYCPGIETKTLPEGVQLVCEVGHSPSDASNCSEPQLPETKATIGCREFYIADNSGRESKTIVLKCDKNGNWTGMDQLRNFTCKQDCGLRSGRKNPFIAYGNVTDQETWPWHAAIFRKKGTKFYYICGGSLITESLIITAAHCVTDSATNRIRTESLLVRLGSKSSVVTQHDDASKDYFVKEIYPHPTYDRSLQADIAILQLNESVIFNKFMAPVCLPETVSMDNRALETGNNGDVVGFGYNENGSLSHELRHVTIPVALHRDCYRDLGSKLTDAQICMGVGKRGENVCQGDSGGGLTFPNEFRTSTYLHGIVSWGTTGAEGRRTLEKSECKNNVVFTRVFSYIPWILEKINDVTGERRIIASEKTNTFTERGTDESYKRFNVILRNNEKVSGLHLQYEDIDPKVLLDGFLERTSGDIETIELESVKLSSEFERKIRLPFLKTLKVDRIVPDWEEDDWVSRFDEFVYSAVFAKKDTEWNISEIAHLNINIEILLGTWRVFKIVHQDGEIVSSVPSTHAILSNLPPELSLKFLTLGNTRGSLMSFQESLIPPSLTYLKFFYIHLIGQGDTFTSQTDLLINIFKRCSNITTFIYEKFIEEPTVADKFKIFDITRFLDSAPNLKKLYVHKANLTSSNDSRVQVANNVQTLILSGCNVSAQLQKNFNMLFQNVKELYFEEQNHTDLTRLVFNSSARKIVIFEEKDPIFQIIKGYDIKTYYALERYANLKGGSTQKIKLCFIFEKNINGVWILKQTLNELAGDLLFSHLSEDDRLFSSNLDIIGGKRLTSKEKYLLQNPEKTYTLYGLINTLLEQRFYFNGFPDNGSFLIPSELTTIDFDRTFIPMRNLVKALGQTWNLENLELTNIELSGKFDILDRAWLPNLQTFEIELLDASTDLNELTSMDNTLMSIMPFYTHHKEWSVNEILLLGVNISFSTTEFYIFDVNHVTGFFRSKLINTNEILKKHKSYTYNRTRVPICKLYELKDYADEKSCEILTNRPGAHKYYRFVINYFNIGYCRVNVEYIPTNLISLRLSNVELLRNGSLTDIFSGSKNLEVVVADMGFRGSPMRSFAETLLDKYSFDISELNTSTLKLLSLYGVGLTQTKPHLPIFTQIHTLAINRCSMDNQTMQHIFEIFPCKVRCHFWLKHEQYLILEQAITFLTNAELKIIILLKFQDKPMLYSNNISSLLKSLNLYYENENYIVYLQRINGTWSGSTKPMYSYMGEYDDEPWDLFSDYPSYYATTIIHNATHHLEIS